VISLHTHHLTAPSTQYNSDCHSKLKNADAKATFIILDLLNKPFGISSREEIMPSGLMGENTESPNYLELLIGVFIRADNVTDIDTSSRWGIG
jgi:hypothetical protein